MSGDAANHFLGGRWVIGDDDGVPFTSTDPATGNTTWQGRAASAREVAQAVSAARGLAPAWAVTPLAERAAVLRKVADEYAKRKTALAQAISAEAGKPRWEALAEVDAIIAKVGISIEAHERRATPTTAVTGGITAATRFKPHGVVAVLGPFNMPGHLPNGHLVPAVLAGNTAVFKPSEQAPLVGQALVEAWEAAGVPPGVINLVQGAAQTGNDLATHPEIDGVFFTGSAAVGIALNRALADRPGTIVALEMGGNNPLIVHECADLAAAAYFTIQSAFITAGQRCSCAASRLIVPSGSQGNAFIERLVGMIGRIRIGLPVDEPEPFMGPVISARAAGQLLEAQAELIRRGGRTLVELKPSPRSLALLAPGMIDVTAVSPRQDQELFGPILQLVRVPDFDAAIREANATRYGLAAGLLSDRRDLYERFYGEIRAGVVAWNRPLTGASSRLPFGGVGMSGNHRPSAYLAADYCSYPVAATESERLITPAQLPPGLAS